MAFHFIFSYIHYRTSKYPQFKASREEFEKQFSDFNNMKTILQLFANTMAVMIEDQDPELQMGLCELQSDILLSSKQNLIYGQLWNFVMPDKYPKLHNFVLKVTAMFGSTYICACTFSTTKMLKSKQRNRLSQEALKSNLRIVTTEMEADIVVPSSMSTLPSAPADKKVSTDQK
ncbi:hypothetical protein PR048_002675, partial [Dryococelus australis]